MAAAASRTIRSASRHTYSVSASVNGARSTGPGPWSAPASGWDQIFGILTDGYRPLLELTVMAAWASQRQTGGEEDPPSPIARATILLNLASLVGLRGFDDLAVAYVGRANSIVDTYTIASARRRTYRFRQGLALEAISFLRGPDHLAETRVAGTTGRRPRRPAGYKRRGANAGPGDHPH
jgi:hypothetical protein